MATKRLIDADEIVKVAEHAHEQWSLAMVGADDTRKVSEVFKKQYLCKVVKAIAQNCPTVDAVEVVHGQWISPTKISARNFNIFHCSVCNGVPPGVDKNTKYCAHCGAMMDGGADYGI